MEKTTVSATVTVTAVERPARKLVLLRAKNATEYFSFCGENGCDWHDILSRLPGALTGSALLTLPENMVAPDTSRIAGGVEVPADFDAPLPEGYEVVELPPCQLLFFQGMPYENEDDYGKAIGIVGEAMEHYQPELYGFEWADELAPRFNFGSGAKNGSLMAAPVRLRKTTVAGQ